MLAVTACTYEPAQEIASVTQVVRIPGGSQALALVQREVLRRPKGLSAFPDGGRIKVLEQESIIYRIDGRGGTAETVASHTPTRQEWESYSMSLAGFASDGSAFFRSTGCTRGGECYPDRASSTHYSVTAPGELRTVDRLPDGVALPGESLGPRPGEDDYVRYSRDAATISVRTDPGGESRVVFRVTASGALVANGGTVGR